MERNCILGIYNKKETADIRYNEYVNMTHQLPYKADIRYTLYSFDFNEKSQSNFFDRFTDFDFYYNVFVEDDMINLKDTVFGDRKKFSGLREDCIFY